MYENISLLEWQQIQKLNQKDFIVQASTIIEPDGWQKFPIGMGYLFHNNKHLTFVGQHENLVLSCMATHTDKRRRGNLPVNRCIIESTLRKNGINNISLDNREYFSILPSYKFVISPEGNGIDCHRHYEALMAGCIPVIEEHKDIKEKYKDLPILYTKDYSEINKEYLEDKYLEMKDKLYNFEKLFLHYYIPDIQREIKLCGNHWMTKLGCGLYYEDE